MTSRRDFLQIGITGGMLLPFAALGDHATLSAAHTPLYKAIFDERFPSGIAFAREMTRRGVAVQAIRGDITALWYQDLYFTWRNRSVRIAGLTTRESLFCLEILACDAGHRVTERQFVDGLVRWSIGPNWKSEVRSQSL
jgi:hypothetical protein